VWARKNPWNVSRRGRTFISSRVKWIERTGIVRTQHSSFDVQLAANLDAGYRMRNSGRGPGRGATLLISYRLPRDTERMFKFPLKPHQPSWVRTYLRRVQKQNPPWRRGGRGVFPLLAMFLQPSFVLVLLALRAAAWNCTSLTSLSLPNVTIVDAIHLPAGSTFTASTDPTCFISTYGNTVNICRVSGAVATSPTSTVKFEMWLPDIWYGRVLTAGNAALGGCKSLFFHSSFTYLIAPFRC
jgi:hypothetical protein